MANEYFVNSADLTSVADAIREKGGTSEQLIFPEGFATAIMAIESGGVSPQLIVTAPAGSTITAINGEETVTGMVGEEGTLTLDLPAFGEWMVTASLNGMNASAAITIQQEYPVELTYEVAIMLHGAPNETINITADEAEIASVALDSSGEGSVTLGGINGKTVNFTGSISGYTKSVQIGITPVMDIGVYPEHSLYWHGRVFEDKTGGWEKKADTNSYYTSTSTVRFDANSIYFSSSKAKSAAFLKTVNKIPIPDGASTLIVKGEGTAANSNGFVGGVMNGDSWNAINGFAGYASIITDGTAEIPVSEFSGDYYIAVRHANAQSSGSYSYNGTVEEVYFE